MQVVILCGGLGTRLAELTDVTPKPMVPIGGRPILWHIMKTYSHFGFDDFILCLGFKGESIRSYFANYWAMNSDLRVEIGSQKIELLEAMHDEARWSVILAETGPDTPTGGRIKKAAKYLEGGTFMATYGDGVADIDIARLAAFHRSHGRLATVTGVRPTSRFGELLVEHGAVRAFREKPQLREAWVNCGYFVFEPKVLDYLDLDKPLEVSALERLAAEGELQMFPHEGYWQSMDTLRDVRLLNEHWSSGSPPWQRWKDRQ